MVAPPVQDFDGAFQTMVVSEASTSPATFDFAAQLLGSGRECQASRASPLIALATGACRRRPEDVQKQAPCIGRRAGAFGR